MLFFSSNYNL